jgi:hypothetical protein
LPPLTLDKLRARFWWLESGRKNSHILALDGDTATIKVIQRTWNHHTQKYEAAVARDFAELGLKVVWRRFWCRPFQERIDRASTQAAERRPAGLPHCYSMWEAITSCCDRFTRRHASRRPSWSP